MASLRRPSGPGGFVFKPLNPTTVVMQPRLPTLRRLFSFPSQTLLRPSPSSSRSGLVLCGHRRRSDRATDKAKRMEVEYNKKRAEGGGGGGKKGLQLKVRKLNPVSTTCHLQILGTGMDTQDTSSSVLLFFDNQRIIFNAGEGLQRFCTEHKIKLSKINHMFLTRVCSETASGLPGLLLTLAGIGDTGMSVNVWGPSDLHYLVGAMKSFIPHAAMVNTHSFGEVTSERNLAPSPCSKTGACGPFVLINDDVVRVSAILLHPRYLGGSANNGDSHVNPKDLKPGDVSVVYICELPEIKGKFDPSKAASLGLRPGPKYRELQLGKSVKSDKLDVTVHPSDVLGPSTPGPVIILVDCPTEFHLSELYSLQSLDRYYTSSTSLQSEDVKTVNCVIHLSPASVTDNIDYKRWMKKFGMAKHILAGHEIKNIKVPVLRSSARITSRLNYLCPQIFPFQLHDESQQKSLSSWEDSCEAISAENLLKFHLRPYALLGVDKSTIPTFLSHDEMVKELITEIPEIVDASNNVSKLWKYFEKARTQTSISEAADMIEEPWIREKTEIDHQQLSSSDFEDIDMLCGLDIPCCLENTNRDEMEIVLLGTGSSQPSKYRNVSAIYINLFSRGGILLDCGEGTLGQLKRRFGMKGADDAVKALRLIWISHIHADHHIGLARILALRRELLRDVPHEPLLVIGPMLLKRFLDAYSQLENLDVQFLDCQHTTEASLNDFSASLTDGEGMRSVSQGLEGTIFSKCNQMQSYWKRPGSSVNSSVIYPLLGKLKTVLQDSGLDSLSSIPVVHCPQAFGVVLKSSQRKNRVGKVIPGWKLVYSADTRPCQALVDASKDATVLIHEATFEDGMEEEAIARNHSTTMEAIRVGAEADAYRIILTHFSQRYPKIPVFDEAHMDKTCIAFDMMSINLADLPILPRILPYLKLLFKDEMAMDAEDVPDVPDVAISN